MHTTHDKDALQAALAYSRYLAKADFTRWMNERRAEVGEPPEAVPILLNTVGQKVYDRIRDELRARRSKSAGVALQEAERRAVIAEIIRCMYEDR
jgi:hypothetical protein